MASSEHKPGYANPAPAGLVALAVACFCFFALLSGQVAHSAMPLLGCWLLGGFIVQITVALIELKQGQLLGGNIFLLFSSFFMLTGGISFFVKAYFNTVGGAPLDTRIDGFAWLVLFVTLLLWTPAYLKTASAVLSLAVMLLDVGTFCIAFTDLGLLPAFASTVAAYALLLCGICGLYLAAATQLNGAFEKTVLPVPGPFLSATPKRSQAATMMPE